MSIIFVDFNFPVVRKAVKKNIKISQAFINTTHSK